MAVTIPPVKLSPRETEVLQHAADGRRYEDTASAMGIKLSTVQDHLKSARYKLGASKTTQAVAIAWRQGLIR